MWHNMPRRGCLTDHYKQHVFSYQGIKLTQYIYANTERKIKTSQLKFPTERMLS